MNFDVATEPVDLAGQVAIVTGGGRGLGRAFASAFAAAGAAVVAANVGCTAAVPALVERIEQDTEPLIRAHALWALAQMDSHGAAPLIERALNDPDSLVREEAGRLKTES